MTVADLLARISSRELTEWQAYYQLEPWGTERIEFMLAQQSAIIWNALRSKDAEAKEPKDFIPTWGEKVERSTEEMLEQVKAINSALGGKEKRKRK